MNILYLSSHAILEYDSVKLWTDLGYDVFSIGAYSDPAHPTVDLRPAIVGDELGHSILNALCQEQRERHAKDSAEYPVIDWAKADLNQNVIDWADTIIVDCYPESWIALNWVRIRDKRVIWRTIGQSGYDTELQMQRLHNQGLQIVRYSPAEKRAYGRYDWFAGEDVLIRFGKDPEDWYGWTGDDPVVGNITQNMAGRGEACGLSFYLAATKDLWAWPAGPGSEKLPGGLGVLSYDAMRQYLRSIRCYLYTGTQPASYTLGLIEALMTGTPVVSIGQSWMIGGDLFEAPELVLESFDDPAKARESLAFFLDHPNQSVPGIQRFHAIETFGTETIGRQWLDFLGSPARVTWQGAEAVGV